MMIPEEYRERYDDLARSHPWMREMRDETATIGDLIEQRTEEIEKRNHLIAKARNSFKSLADNTLDADSMRKGCRLAYERMDEEMKRMGIAADGRAIEALDEPINGIGGETNGIADEITLPEDDAASILRKAAKCTSVNTSIGDVLRYNVPGNGCSAWQTDEDACEALADMVERDYVRRDDFNKMRERHRKERVYWQNEMHAVLDTLNGKERFWGACVEYPLDEHSLSPSEIAKQTLERNYVRREEYVALGKSLGIAQAKRDGLTAERDEYRNMAGKMLDAAQEIRRIADASMPEGAKAVM